MPLALYLDDCAYSKRLVEMLRAEGHRVLVPVDFGCTGRDDDVHFLNAVNNGLILVTKNPADFVIIHQHVPEHPGILVIYQDNDSSRDMSNREIVAAIKRLEETFARSQTALANQVHILNHWRQ